MDIRKHAGFDMLSFILVIFLFLFNNCELDYRLILSLLEECLELFLTACEVLRIGKRVCFSCKALPVLYLYPKYATKAITTIRIATITIAKAPPNRLLLLVFIAIVFSVIIVSFGFFIYFCLFVC